LDGHLQSHPTPRQATFAQLSSDIGLDVEAVLRRLGATRFEDCSHPKASRVHFPASDLVVPITAFVMTRVIPVHLELRD